MDNREMLVNKVQLDNRDHRVETDNQVKMDPQVIADKMELMEHLACAGKQVSQENLVLTDLPVVKVAKAPMASQDSLVDEVHAVNKVEMVKRAERVPQGSLVYVDLLAYQAQTQMYQWIR